MDQKDKIHHHNEQQLTMDSCFQCVYVCVCMRVQLSEYLSDVHTSKAKRIDFALCIW